MSTLAGPVQVESINEIAKLAPWQPGKSPKISVKNHLFLALENQLESHLIIQSVGKSLVVTQ